MKNKDNNENELIYNTAKVKEIYSQPVYKYNLFDPEYDPFHEENNVLLEEAKLLESRINLQEVILLRQFKLLQQLDNKILKGRIKDKETEKIKLQYYKVYLDAVNTFIKLAKGNGIETSYDKDFIKDFFFSDIEELD